MNLAPVAPNDIQLGGAPDVHVALAARFFQGFVREYVGDDVHEQFGEQESRRVPKMAVAIDVELHGRRASVDDDLTFLWAVNRARR